MYWVLIATQYLVLLSQDTLMRLSMYRVQWTSHERRALATAIIDILADRPALSIVAAINLAQENFHESRRRRVQSVALLPWLDSEMDSIRRERETLARELAAKVEAESKPKPSVDLSGVSDGELLQELVARAGQLLGPLIDAAVQKSLIGPYLDIRIQEAVTEAFKSQPIAQVQAPQPAKKKKPMVVLAGLLPTQFNAVVAEFGNTYDLRSWGADESPNRLKSLCVQAYRVVAMTDKLAHKHTDLMHSLNKPAYVPFSGGVTTLKRVISEFELVT